MKGYLGKIFGKPGKETREFQVRVSQKSAAIDNQQFAGPYKPGDLIGQDYEVHKVLGIGGCGIVYLVYSRSQQSVYALKTFRDHFLTERSVRERFRREAEVWVNLERHPYLVRAHFVERIDGRLFVGMEYVAPNEDGINSLSDYLERGPISLDQCLRWAIQFCRGMEHAFAMGIRCHRDIKPANIMIDRNAFIKISDFGLAGVLRSPKLSLMDLREHKMANATSIQTIQGLSFGTPTHMSPEQFIDAAQCDERSDIYSFGVVLHQMQNNGALPFLAPLPRDGTHAEQIRFWESMFQLHANSPAPPFVSPMSAIIKRCLEKERNNRYQTFAKLRGGIEKILFDKTGRKISPPNVREYDAGEWNNKGGSFYTLGHSERALECFDKALQSAPGFVEVWTNKALLLQSLDRLDEAMGCIDKALELDPRYAPALVNKGSILNKLKRFNQAIDCFDEALRVNDKLYGAWSNKGDTLMTLARFDEALVCFDKSLALFRKTAEVWVHKAACLQALGKAEAAIDCCDNAIEINPHARMALHGKAVSLSTLGNYEAAYSAIKGALSVEGSYPAALFIRAGIEEALGKESNAIISYREFLALSSQEDSEENDFANMRIRYMETKQEEPASIKSAKLRLAKNAMTYRGKMPHISALNNLAGAYKEIKQYEKAILAYNEALTIIETKCGSDSPAFLLAPTLNNLASLYHEVGKYIEAKGLYERAIQVLENDTLRWTPESRQKSIEFKLHIRLH